MDAITPFFDFFSSRFTLYIPFAVGRRTELIRVQARLPFAVMLATDAASPVAVDVALTGGSCNDVSRKQKSMRHLAAGS